MQQSTLVEKEGGREVERMRKCDVKKKRYNVSKQFVETGLKADKNEMPG